MVLPQPPTRSVIRRNEGEETKEFGERTAAAADHAVGRHSSSEDVNELSGGKKF